MIRDYGQAAKDLNRLVSLLTKQLEENIIQCGTFDISNSVKSDLKQARLHLSEVEEFLHFWNGRNRKDNLTLGMALSCTLESVFGYVSVLWILLVVGILMFYFIGPMIKWYI